MTIGRPFALAALPVFVIYLLIAAPTHAQPQAKPGAQAQLQAPVPAQHQPQLQTPAETEPAILHSRPDRVIAALDNRLIIVAQRFDAAPVVSVQTWIKTGSIYEQEHVGAGLSHFLEHLLSGGSTSNRPEAQSNAMLGQMGAATNAATSLDTVRYYINTTSQNTGEALALMTDWMRNNIVAQAEFEREQQVIQREFSMGAGDPGRIFWKLTQQARYVAHPARHPTIGYLDEFLSVTRDEIEDFYHRMYVPNNMLVVVVGDIDPQAVVKQAGQLWGDAKLGKLPKLSFPIEPTLDKPTEAQGIADVRRPRVRLMFPGVKLQSEHDYALDLLAVTMGQGEASRLVQRIRNQQQLVNDISSYNMSFSWGEGGFGIDAELAIDADADDAAISAAVAKLRTAVLEQIEQVRTTPIDQAELDRARRVTMSYIVQANQTAEGIASRLASDLIHTGNPDYRTHYADAIAKLTPADLQAAARAILRSDRLITVVLKPQPDGYEPTPIKREQSAELDLPAEPIDLDNAGLIEQIRKHTADDQSQLADVGIEPAVRVELDNGLTVLLQRSTFVPAVAMQYYTKGGLLRETIDTAGTTNAMAAMLTRGTSKYSADELAGLIESLGASLRANCGNNTTYVTASALRDDFATMFDLMAHVMTEPTFPEDQWQLLQPRLLAAIDRQGDRWSGELRQEFRKVYYGDHPWSQTTLGSRGVVSKLTTEDLKGAHGTAFDPASSVLAITGDFDIEHAKSLIEASFGKWRGAGGAAFEPPMTTHPGAMLVQVPTAKPVTAVQIAYGPGIDRASPDYAGMQVLSRVIGDFPAGYLQQALRGEGPGLVYASWAGAVTGIVPGYFSVVFNTLPDSAPEALSRSLAVIDRVKNEPIDDTTLARAKAKVLTTEFFSRQSNADRAANAALDMLYGVDDLTGEAFEKAVLAITADTLRELANARLTDPSIVIVTNKPIAPDKLIEIQRPRE